MGAESSKIIMNSSIKNNDIIDDAWDEFSEHIGENKIKTPITLEQFEQIFAKLNQNNKYNNLKDSILKSFRYDSYSWPLVEKNPK